MWSWCASQKTRFGGKFFPTENLSQEGSEFSGQVFRFRSSRWCFVRKSCFSADGGGKPKIFVVGYFSPPTRKWGKMIRFDRAYFFRWDWKHQLVTLGPGFRKNMKKNILEQRLSYLCLYPKENLEKVATLDAKNKNMLFLFRFSSSIAIFVWGHVTLIPSSRPSHGTEVCRRWQGVVQCRLAKGTTLFALPW